MIGQYFEERIKQDCETTNVFCHRLKTRISGFKNDNEPGDFIIAHKGRTMVLEAKTTQDTSFSLTMIRPNQFIGLLEASKYSGVNGAIIVEMRKYDTIHLIPIEDIKDYLDKGKKSIPKKELDKYIVAQGGEVIDFPKALKQGGVTWKKTIH